MGDLHAQRHRVQAQNLALRTHGVGQFLCKQAGAAIELQHTHAGCKIHGRYQCAAIAQPAFEFQLLVVSGQRRRRGR
jgi:hypothetical protein